MTVETAPTWYRSYPKLRVTVEYAEQGGPNRIQRVEIEYDAADPVTPDLIDQVVRAALTEPESFQSSQKGCEYPPPKAPSAPAEVSVSVGGAEPAVYGGTAHTTTGAGFHAPVFEEVPKP